MDEKTAATPKASGANSLVTIGMARTPSACAKTVPDISFKTLPEKLFDGFVKEEIFTGKTFGCLKS
jgi:hypothetical protein